MKIILVDSDDWQGLYVDGELSLETHSISLDDAISSIVSEINSKDELGKFFYKNKYIDGEILEIQFGAEMPKKLKDLEGYLE